MFFYLRVLLSAIFFLSSSGLGKPFKNAEIYIVGGDVKPPKVVHYVEPEPSEQGSYVEGVVQLSAVVETDGVPSDLHVVKGLNEEEDKLALEALRQWRFSPGTKGGQAVRVRIKVEINFHLL